MFGTFRYNQDTNDHEHIQITKADGLEARGYTRTACKPCRTRKLKCSGDKDGCRRCLSQARHCSYESQSPTADDHDLSGHKPSTTRAGPGRKGQAIQTTPSSAVQVTAGPSNPASLAGIHSPLSTLLPSTELSWDELFPDIAGPVIPGTLDASLVQGFHTDISIFNTSHSSSGASCRPGTVHSERDRSLSSLSSRELSTSQSRGSDGDYTNAEITTSRMQNTQTPLVHQTAISEADQQTWDFFATNIDPTAKPYDQTEEFPDPQFRASPAMRSNPHFDVDQILLSGAKLGHELTAPSSSQAVVSGSESNVTLAPMLSRAHTDNNNQNMSKKSKQICYCLGSMAQILEDVGAQGLGSNSHTVDTGLDIFLITIEHGMRTCDAVMACKQCKSRSEYGMLIAVVAQQLGITAECAMQRVPLRTFPRAQGQRNVGVNTPRSIFGASTGMSPTMPARKRSSSVALEGGIRIGQYEIETPEIRLLLVQHTMRLQLCRLRTLLGRMKAWISPNKGAWKLLADTENKIVKILEVFQADGCVSPSE